VRRWAARQCSRHGSELLLRRRRRRARRKRLTTARFAFRWSKAPTTTRRDEINGPLPLLNLPDLTMLLLLLYRFLVQVAEVRSLLSALAEMQRTMRTDAFAERARLSDEHERLGREAEARWGG